ncbi:hypothetical protein OS493_016048 [Desmophyllum pertusum]|uniref:Uncharacterized protein n=1 Tax=Desmophyllum pertusum TaxID=174260 RepID=A0A9X0A1I7_9CNID|nr:hypothetical protein OS493_016048 [Desmophyllum pertusum]
MQLPRPTACEPFLTRGTNKGLGTSRRSDVMCWREIYIFGFRFNIFAVVTCELSSLENMAQNSPTGPIRLAKPTGVIKLKVKKKKKTTQSTSIRSSNALKPINGPIQDGGRVHALKRKNPFRCSPRKKTNLTSDAKTSECRLFNVLDGLDEDIENVSTNTVNSTAENTSQNTFDPHVVDSEQTEVEIPIDEIEGLQTFPLDWSLKSKIRFTSSKSFNWCGTLKTLHEGEGLSNFVRCQTRKPKYSIQRMNRLKIQSTGYILRHFVPLLKYGCILPYHGLKCSHGDLWMEEVVRKETFKSRMKWLLVFTVIGCRAFVLFSIWCELVSARIFIWWQIKTLCSFKLRELTERRQCKCLLRQRLKVFARHCGTKVK